MECLLGSVFQSHVVSWAAFRGLLLKLSEVR